MTTEEEAHEEAGHAAEALLHVIMAEQRSWKDTAAFVKPGLVFEHDPLFALFLFVAILVFAISYLWQLHLNSALPAAVEDFLDTPP
jgi:hypothetical protein